MDPNACLAEFIVAAVAGDPDGVAEYAAALRGWLRRGGFRPDRSGVETGLARVLPPGSIVRIDTGG